MYKNETHSIYKQSNASLALLQMSVKALREVRCFYPPRLTFVYKSVIHPPYTLSYNKTRRKGAFCRTHKHRVQTTTANKQLNINTFDNTYNHS